MIFEEKEQQFDHNIPSNILTLYEAEHYVESLTLFSFKDIGSTSFLNENKKIEALNRTAHYHAIYQQHDEYIVNLFNTHQKIDILIGNLIQLELWNLNILPLLIKESSQLKSALYIIQYTEVTYINLLEVLLYHEYSFQCIKSDDVLLELSDYCYRYILKLIDLKIEKKVYYLKYHYFIIYQ